jgi:hypothetical protein
MFSRIRFAQDSHPGRRQLIEWRRRKRAQPIERRRRRTFVKNICE